MQPADGVERRCDRSLLPTAYVGGMFARQRNASVDLAQIVIVLGAGVLGPHAETTHGKGRAMPRDGDSVIELLWVLGMNLAAVIHRFPYALIRRHGGELHGIRTPDVRAQEHAFADAVKPGVRIGDGADGQIGVGDSAIDMLVFLPEAALELQTRLDGRGIRYG